MYPPALITIGSMAGACAPHTLITDHTHLGLWPFPPRASGPRGRLCTRPRLPPSIPSAQSSSTHGTAEQHTSQQNRSTAQHSSQQHLLVVADRTGVEGIGAGIGWDEVRCPWSPVYANSDSGGLSGFGCGLGSERAGGEGSLGRGIASCSAYRSYRSDSDTTQQKHSTTRGSSS